MVVFLQTVRKCTTNLILLLHKTIKLISILLYYDHLDSFVFSQNMIISLKESPSHSGKMI